MYEPYLVWTNASFVDQGATTDFYIDIECGTTDDYNNTFSLQLQEDIAIAPNAAVYVDGEQWGGLVQRRITETDTSVFQWEGRTWNGVWADKIIEPASGQDYYIINGTVADCVTALITKLGLSTLFAVGTCPNTTITNYQFYRYVDGWAGLCMMLESVDLRPEFVTSNSSGTLQVLINAVDITTLDEVANGALSTIEMVSEFLPPNHVIGLGTGELHNRAVCNYYADANGVVSTTQTFTGVDERTIKYENTSAALADLQVDAIKALEDEQTKGTVEMQLNEGVYAALGDYVIGYDQRIDVSVTVPVVGQVVKIENGITTINCKAGGAIASLQDAS